MKVLPDVTINQDVNNGYDFQYVTSMPDLVTNLEAILVDLEMHEKHLACAMLQRCIDELTAG